MREGPSDGLAGSTLESEGCGDPGNVHVPTRFQSPLATRLHRVAMTRGATIMNTFDVGGSFDVGGTFDAF